MDADGVFGDADGLARRREQRELRGRTVENVRERFGGLLGVARHEGKFVVHLRGDDEIAAAPLARLHHVQDRVGIAAEAVTVVFPRHELRHDIDAALDEIARRMRVVRGDVALLRAVDGQPLSGDEEELVDLDIVRHRAVPQCLCVSKFGIAPEKTLDHRIEETVFKLAFCARFLKRQRSEDRKPDRTIGRGARVQSIRNMVRLAEAEWQPEHDILADLCDDRFGNGLRILMEARHSTLERKAAMASQASGSSSVVAWPILGTSTKSMLGLIFFMVATPSGESRALIAPRTRSTGRVASAVNNGTMLGGGASEGAANAFAMAGS